MKNQMTPVQHPTKLSEILPSLCSEVQNFATQTFKVFALTNLTNSSLMHYPKQIQKDPKDPHLQQEQEIGVHTFCFSHPHFDRF